MQLVNLSKHFLNTPKIARYEVDRVFNDDCVVTGVFSGNAQTVNFSGKDVPLKKIFSTIKKQTGTLFFYDDALMKEAKPVTVHLKNVTIGNRIKRNF